MSVVTQENATDNLTLYEDLLKLLQCEKVRFKASEVLSSLSDSKSFVDICVKNENFLKKLIRQILQCLDTKVIGVTINCYKGLINISAIESAGKYFDELNSAKILTELLVQHLKHQKIKLIMLSTMLLANVYQSKASRECFLCCDAAGNPYCTCELVVQKFLDLYAKEIPPEAFTFREEVEDPFFYIGHVLMNLTVSKVGRVCVLRHPNLENIIRNICYLTLHNSNLIYKKRQPFIINVFSNLLMDQESINLLVDSHMIVMICALVYPPAGSINRRLKVDSTSSWFPPPAIVGDTESIIDPEIDKLSCGLCDSDETRKIISNIFFCLVHCEYARKKLRQMHTYDVVRVWHLMETNNTIKISIECWVQALIQTEEELATSEIHD